MNARYISEEIVRVWASDYRCPYEDLGRPTLRKHGERRGSTLDFTFRHKATGKIYVAELKCEIEYQDYKYFVLSDARQLAHHDKIAFVALLDAAARSSEQQAFLRGKEVEISGAILIWGDATSDGRRSIIDAYGFFEVMTMADIVDDLKKWRHDSYRKLIEDRRIWTNEMLDALSPL